MFASIPSPGDSAIELGPLTLRAYGLMIALGVLAAVWLAQKRWSERGGGEGDISAIAMVAVPAGLIGARAYHVITDWQTYEGRWLEAFKIWEGGLGIPGGIALGIAAGVWAGKRRGFSIADLMDACTPALPLAQAIGRLGNWFNQELFGKPSDLPWALEIDAEHRPAEYAAETTFHPTFLYESLWNIAVVALILWIDKRKVMKPGRLVFVYLVGYAVGRLWIEAIRVDFAEKILGVRVNIWVMSVVGIVGLVGIVTGLRRGDTDADHEGESAELDDDPDDSDELDEPDELDELDDPDQVEASTASDSDGQAS